MSPTRRQFLGAAAAVAAGAALRPVTLDAVAPGQRVGAVPADRFDPWVEVEAAALRHNVREVARLAGGRPVLAVVKNNAYGLGTVETSRVLDGMPEVAGLAVVKADAALRLGEAGLRTPVLLMAMASDEEAQELASRGVRLALYTDDAPRRLDRLARRRGAPLPVQLYLDTGMSRMGMPHHRALPWLEALAARGDVRVEGTFMAFTEDDAFDREQLRRFVDLAGHARRRGLELGALHAASSHAVFHLPEAHLDRVRPGIALYGAYPADFAVERALADLTPAFRLRARVVRVERLRTGDSVSYGRNFVAREPTWIATLPAGHTDGVPRRAVDGGRVLIGRRTYPVIGAVSASLTVVELGPETEVRVGDAATLVGPEHPDIHPNALAQATGVSVYDVLMHLNPSLPRVVV